MALAIAATAPLATGCTASDASDDSAGESTGQLVLSLIQPGPHGDLYHLANAVFDVTTANGTTLTAFGGGTETQVTLSVPPGLANVQLRDGWTLEHSVDGGVTFQPVSALLGSPNPNALRVLASQPVFVEFTFLIREINGTLAISLGVVPEPRELAGGFLVNTATADLAGYADPANRRMDIGVFFQLLSITSQALDDGTKQRTYTAFGQQGSLGPTPLPPSAVAAEFYNDNLGTLSGPIAAELAGGTLQYVVAARPDGTIELSGSLSGGDTSISFGPAAIDAILPTLGADGFPNDEFFYASQVPFTQTSAQGTLDGILRVRHLVPTP